MILQIMIITAEESGKREGEREREREQRLVSV